MCTPVQKDSFPTVMQSAVFECRQIQLTFHKQGLLESTSGKVCSKNFHQSPVDPDQQITQGLGGCLKKNEQGPVKPALPPFISKMGGPPTMYGRGGGGRPLTPPSKMGFVHYCTHDCSRSSRAVQTRRSTRQPTQIW